MLEIFCRLCLQTIGDNNSQPVEESLLKFLKLNTNICKENVMCIDCANCLQVFSNFLPSCVYTGDRTLPFADLENGVKLEPEAFHTKTNQKSFMETDIKCSFCTHTHGREDLISLKESKENTFLANMLEQYILETHLKNTEELLICGTCFEALQRGLNVISKCLKVEEKLSKYIELVGTDDKGQVELKDVQQFMFRPKIKLEIESFGASELEDECVQIQGEYTAMAETEMKDEEGISDPELTIKAEDDNVAAKQSDCDVPHIKSEHSGYDGFQESSVENETPNDSLDISAITSEMRKSMDRILLTHENPSEIEMLKCKLCRYKTKRKGNFRRHLLLHKSPSGMKMRKCKLCSFETIYGNSFKQHLLTHKSPSEIKMFKCESCSYEAKQKGQLNIHQLTHKSPSEIEMFKCQLCSYEAKLRSHLKSHSLTHKSPSEIKMFKCELCSFETKQNYQLNRHLLIHKDPSEIRMFKCESCSYETKRRATLIKHLKTHKIKIIKCELCSYEARLKGQLKAHLLTHRIPPPIKMYKCEFCTYEVRQKNILKKHLLTHKSPSQIKMYKCELCSYETKLKYHHKVHLLTHKNPEIKMYKHEKCPDKAKQKINLKTHLSANESLSDILMFNCELCSYETKCKVNFMQHLSIHESRQELKMFIKM